MVEISYCKTWLNWPAIFSRLPSPSILITESRKWYKVRSSVRKAGAKEIQNIATIWTHHKTADQLK